MRSTIEFNFILFLLAVILSFVQINSYSYAAARAFIQDPRLRVKAKYLERKRNWRRLFFDISSHLITYVAFLNIYVCLEKDILRYRITYPYAIIRV